MTAVPRVSATILVAAFILALATGIFLYRLATRLGPTNGRTAFFDLAAALYGVLFFSLIVFSLDPHIPTPWFILIAIITGILTSALFRACMHPPR